MFGAGKGQVSGEQVEPPFGAPIEPPSTSSLWGDMFGMGSLLKLVSDPALGAHAHQMMGALIEAAQASQRIEKKLDTLLKALGHEIDGIATRTENDLAAAQARPGVAPPLLAAHRADGGGGFAPASLAPDDGDCGSLSDGRTDHDGGEAYHR